MKVSMVEVTLVVETNGPEDFIGGKIRGRRSSKRCVVNFSREILYLV